MRSECHSDGDAVGLSEFERLPDLGEEPPTRLRGGASSKHVALGCLACAGLVAVVLFVVAPAVVEAPSVELAGVRVSHVNFVAPAHLFSLPALSMDYDVRLHVTNPNSISVRLIEADVDVRYRGSILGSANLQAPVDLDAGSTATASLVVNMVSSASQATTVTSLIHDCRLPLPGDGSIALEIAVNSLTVSALDGIVSVALSSIPDQTVTVSCQG